MGKCRSISNVCGTFAEIDRCKCSTCIFFFPSAIEFYFIWCFIFHNNVECFANRMFCKSNIWNFHFEYFVRCIRCNDAPCTMHIHNNSLEIVRFAYKNHLEIHSLRKQILECHITYQAMQKEHSTKIWKIIRLKRP